MEIAEALGKMESTDKDSLDKIKKLYEIWIDIEQNFHRLSNTLPDKIKTRTVWNLTRNKRLIQNVSTENMDLFTKQNKDRPKPQIRYMHMVL